MLTRRLFVERLETRVVLDGLGLPPADVVLVEPDAEDGAYELPPDAYHPVILAGDPDRSGSFPNGRDTPDDRVTSDFRSVGSLTMGRGRSSGLCTGTLVTNGSEHENRFVLTAGHCLDINGDGRADFKPDNVTFYHFEGQIGWAVKPANLYIHPDFTGFGNPDVKDDIAIVELASAISDVTPMPIHGDGTAKKELHFVGFGLTGDGVSGYEDGSARFWVKREGGNIVNSVGGSGGVFYADFDPPDTYQQVGGSLGNQIETTFGPGDSGGPGLVDANADGIFDAVATVNTFSYDRSGIRPPYFGSGMGGIVIAPYLQWIGDVLAGNVTNGKGKGGGNGGGKGGGNRPNSFQADLSSFLDVTIYADATTSHAFQRGHSPQPPVPATPDPAAEVDSVFRFHTAVPWRVDDLSRLSASNEHRAMLGARLVLRTPLSKAVDAVFTIGLDLSSLEESGDDLLFRI